MTTRAAVATVATAGILAVGGVGAAVALTGSSSSSETTSTAERGCNDWTGTFDPKVCYVAGIIRYVALSNLQGSGQFCKWRAANPGEWSRLKSYAENPSTPPAKIVTWLGASIRDLIQGYAATGAPAFTIAPNTAPNVCRTPIPGPTIAGVTPGESSATVTITPP